MRFDFAKCVSVPFGLGLAIALAQSTPTWAADLPKKAELPKKIVKQKTPFLPDWLLISPEVSARVSSPTVVAGLPSPQLYAWGFALKFGYMLPRDWIPSTVLHAGFGISDDVIAQQSTVIPDVGNMTGHRLDFFAPFLRGVVEDTYLAELQLHGLGSYALSRPTTDGANLSYSSVLGVSLTAGYNVGQYVNLKGLYAGARVEYLTFKNITHSVNGTKALDSPLVMTELGFVVSYAF